MSKLSALWSAASSIPALMSSGYGILIRIGLITLVAAGIWAWGATWGYQHEEAKLDVFNAQVKTIADQALKRRAELTAEYSQNLKTVKEQYGTDVEMVRAWHAANPLIVVRKNTSSCPAPAPSTSPENSDGAPRESVATGSNKVTVEVTVDFITACAIDAAKVNGLRSYVILNNIPVEQ